MARLVLESQSEGKRRQEARDRRKKDKEHARDRGRDYAVELAESLNSNKVDSVDNFHGEGNLVSELMIETYLEDLEAHAVEILSESSILTTPAQTSRRRLVDMARDNVSMGLDAMVGHMNPQIRHKEEQDGDASRKKRTDDKSMRLTNLLQYFIRLSTENQRKIRVIENSVDVKAVRGLRSKLADKEKQFKECDDERKKHCRKSTLTTTALEEANARLDRANARISELTSKSSSSGTSAGATASEDTASLLSTPLRRRHDEAL